MSDIKNTKREKEAQKLISYAAQQASRRPFYLASALEIFSQFEQLDEAGLAKLLGLTREVDLKRLALCRRPDVTNPTAFRQDVITIADKFGITPSALANLLRRAAAYEAEQKNQSSYLMAARDRDEEAEAESEIKKNMPEAGQETPDHE